MGITRLRNSKQLGTSPSENSVLVSDTAKEPSWMAPAIGQNTTLYYKHATTSWTPLTFSNKFTISGDQLDVNTGGGGFYTAVKEEGVTVGAGNSAINFVGAAYTAADGGSGVTNITADETLNAWAVFNSNGVLVQTSADNFAARTLTGTTGNIVITNGTGISGNPTFDVGANIPKLDANNTFTGTNTFTLNVVAAAVPTIGDHLVNKTYVDGLLAGVRRSSVKAATLVDGTLATAFENGDTIDGVVLTTGDRILIKNQATQSQNGIYTVNVSGAPTRAADMDIAAEVDGTLVIVENGSQQGQLWYTVSDVITLGTDPIVFTKVSTGSIDGSGVNKQVTFWQDSDTIQGYTKFLFDKDANSGNGALTIGDTTPLTSTIITTRGTTDTNASYAYKHMQGTGGTVFEINDLGETSVGLSAKLTIASQVVSSNGNLSVNVNPGSSLTLGIGGSTSSATDIRIGRSNTTHASGTVSSIHFESTKGFKPTSGGGVYNGIRFNYTIDQTGGSSGISRAILIDPVLTSASDFRGIEISTHASHYAIWSKLGKVRLDVGSDVNYDILYRDNNGNLARLGMGTTGQVLLANTTAAPTWGAVPVGGAVDEGYITGATTNIFDLDVSGTAKDVNGANIVFTIPTNYKLFHVFLNGQKLVRTGSGPVADYTIDSATHVLTLTSAVIATDILYFYKHG